MSRRAVAWATALAWAPLGCGYHAIAPARLARHGRVAVLPPAEAGPVGVAADLGRALSRRLAAGGVALTRSVAGADAVLDGELSVATLPAVSRAGVLTYQLGGSLRLVLRDAAGTPHALGAVAATEDYLPAPAGREPAETEAGRRAALFRLAERLADAAYEQLLLEAA